MTVLLSRICYGVRHRTRRFLRLVRRKPTHGAGRLLRRKLVKRSPYLREYRRLVGHVRLLGFAKVIHFVTLRLRSNAG